MTYTFDLQILIYHPWVRRNIHVKIPHSVLEMLRKDEHGRRTLKNPDVPALAITGAEAVNGCLKAWLGRLLLEPEPLKSGRSLLSSVWIFFARLWGFFTAWWNKCNSYSIQYHWKPNISDDMLSFAQVCPRSPAAMNQVTVTGRAHAEKQGRVQTCQDSDKPKIETIRIKLQGPEQERGVKRQTWELFPRRHGEHGPTRRAPWAVPLSTACTFNNKHLLQMPFCLKQRCRQEKTCL